MLLVTDFRSHCDPNVSGTPGSGYGEFVQTHSVGLFRPVLYAISHRFSVPLRSERFGNPRVWLLGTREKSQFWPIPASFVRYYSLILGPAAIQMFREPRGPVTENSSKLVFWPIPVSFVCYYSLILVPAAIRMFREPCGVVTWTS